MSIYEVDELVERYSSLSIEDKEKLSKFMEHQLLDIKRGHFADRKNLTHRVTGRLVFEFDQNKPIHNMMVELWDRDVVTPDDFLGRSITDKDGHFEIWYDPLDAGFNDLPDLDIRFFEVDHEYDDDGSVTDKYHLIHSEKGDDDVTIEHYEFGTLKIPYWEYAQDAGSPRVHVPEFGSPPETYSNGRMLAMVTSVAPLEAVKRKHFLVNKLHSNKPSLASIQKSYPKSVTMFMEDKEAGSSRSDEYFGDRFLNGMIASNLDKDPRDPSMYWLFHQWNSYEQDGIHCLPNIDIKFKVENEKLLPVRIVFTMREKGATAAGSPTEKVVVENTEGEKWMQAKRLARVSASFWAELEAHLINTHLNVEQYAIPFKRNIRKNPIRYLLAAHVKEVASINHGANTMLVGEDGFITKACALTNDGINERITQSMGMLDWKNWKPRNPICATHRYAHCAALYWDALGEYVEQYFAENLDQIKSHWYEVHRFSEDLVNNSNAFYMCSYLSKALSHDDSWFSKNERPDLNVERRTTDGKVHAVSPITQSDTPTDADIENIKQVCKYVVMHSTFMHSWANDRQHEDGGELMYSGLGLRYGKNGVFSPESDLSIAPDPKSASEQLWFATFLSRTKFGFVMKNEDKDINPMFLNVLRKYIPAFEKLDFNIDELQSRTNI